MDSSVYKLANGITVTLRTPFDVSKPPVVILCHGFCGIQKILLPAFAEAFTQAGFAALTFDYRGFGESDGERGRLVPALQIEDILTVIHWARQQSALDAERIALWGTSFGGCHVFAAAAQDPHIKCVVSQLGFADGEALITRAMDEDEKKAFIATLEKMAEKRRTTGKEMFVNINRVLSDEESQLFFEANKIRFPEMDIKIPFLTIRETLRYKPAHYAAHISCPALVVIAGKDTVNPPVQGRALFDAVGAGEKSLYEVVNARHYDIYYGEFFEQVSRVEIEWLKKYL